MKYREPGYPGPKYSRVHECCFPQTWRLAGGYGYSTGNTHHLNLPTAPSRPPPPLTRTRTLTFTLTPITTPTAQDASADFCKGIRTLGCYGDYLVVNVSSPNTPGLRDLQKVAAIRDVITSAMAARDKVLRCRSCLFGELRWFCYRGCKFLSVLCHGVRPVDPVWLWSCGGFAVVRAFLCWGRVTGL